MAESCLMPVIMNSLLVREGGVFAKQPPKFRVLAAQSFALCSEVGVQRRLQADRALRRHAVTRA